MKRGKNWARMRQAASPTRRQTGTRARHRTAPDRSEGNGVVISRIFGAAIRAFLVSSMVVLPALMLGPNGSDGAQISVLVAILAAVFVLAEYSSSYPSFVEFRHAPPFNRMRFVMLLLMVVCLTLLARHGAHPGLLTGHRLARGAGDGRDVRPALFAGAGVHLRPAGGFEPGAGGTGARRRGAGLCDVAHRARHLHPAGACL